MSAARILRRIAPGMPGGRARARGRSVPSRRQRGAAAVEMALVALPLLLMLGGVADFGRAIHAHDVIARQVRAAARHLALGDPADATRQAQAVSLVRCGRLDCTGAAAWPGVPEDAVAIAHPMTGSVGGDAAVRGIVVRGTDGATLGRLDLVAVSVEGFEVQLVFPLAMLAPGAQACGTDRPNCIRFGRIAAAMPVASS